MTLYWGERCANCSALEAYFAANSPERLAAIIRKEIHRNPQNHAELYRVGKACGIPEERIDIPFLAVGNRCLIGNSDIITFLEDHLPG